MHTCVYVIEGACMYVYIHARNLRMCVCWGDTGRLRGCERSCVDVCV